MLARSNKLTFIRLDFCSLKACVEKDIYQKGNELNCRKNVWVLKGKDSVNFEKIVMGACAYEL